MNQENTKRAARALTLAGATLGTVVAVLGNLLLLVGLPAAAYLAFERGDTVRAFVAALSFALLAALLASAWRWLGQDAREALRARRGR